jgi:hypothetical protein
LDIGAVYSAMNQSDLYLKVGVAVTKLALDTAEQSSQDLSRVMEQSVNPNVGQNIDVKV